MIFQTDERVFQLCFCRLTTTNFRLTARSHKSSKHSAKTPCRSSKSCERGPRWMATSVWRRMQSSTNVECWRTSSTIWRAPYSWPNWNSWTHWTRRFRRKSLSPAPPARQLSCTTLALDDDRRSFVVWKKLVADIVTFYLFRLNNMNCCYFLFWL